MLLGEDKTPAKERVCGSVCKSERGERLVNKQRGDTHFDILHAATSASRRLYNAANERSVLSMARPCKQKVCFRY